MEEKLGVDELEKMIFMERVLEEERKQSIVREILEALPERFDVAEEREEYINDSAEQICLVANNNGRAVGFLCLQETGKDTVGLAVMGVLEEFRREGVGRELFDFAKEIAREKGCRFG